MKDKTDATAWWAKGLLFENCNCQVVCPGHVHFDQNCTLDRCIGYWAIRFDSGEYGGLSIAGCKAVIAYDSPRHMIDGDWTEMIVIDTEASPEQRAAIEAVLTGAAGGPWQVLGRFVGRRAPTRFEPITIGEGNGTKSVSVPGILEGSIQHLRGRDKDKPVTFSNMFNQIHDTTQVIATGNTDYDDGAIAVKTRGTHSLYSHFNWSVKP